MSKRVAAAPMPAADHNIDEQVALHLYHDVRVTAWSRPGGELALMALFLESVMSTLLQCSALPDALQLLQQQDKVDVVRI